MTKATNDLFLISTNFNLNNYMWVLAIILDSTELKKLTYAHMASLNKIFTEVPFVLVKVLTLMPISKCMDK